MSTVQDLERKVQSLTSQLKEAEKSLYLARCSNAGLVAGETLLKTTDGKIFKFSTAKFWNADADSKPWLVSGYMLKKDGIFSTATRNIYSDWEIVKS